MSDRNGENIPQTETSANKPKKPKIWNIFKRRSENRDEEFTGIVLEGEIAKIYLNRIYGYYDRIGVKYKPSKKTPYVTVSTRPKFNDEGKQVAGVYSSKTDNTTVHLDPSDNNFEPTIIHELLHFDGSHFRHRPSRTDTGYILREGSDEGVTLEEGVVEFITARLNNRPAYDDEKIVNYFKYHQAWLLIKDIVGADKDFERVLAQSRLQENENFEELIAKLDWYFNSNPPGYSLSIESKSTHKSVFDELMGLPFNGEVIKNYRNKLALRKVQSKFVVNTAERMFSSWMYEVKRVPDFTVPGIENHIDSKLITAYKSWLKDKLTSEYGPQQLDAVDEEFGIKPPSFDIDKAVDAMVAVAIGKHPALPLYELAKILNIEYKLNLVEPKDNTYTDEST